MTATLDTAAPYAPPDGCRPFLRTIAERPDDMGPRLVFADWLDEHGDPWGEFIRIGVELAGVGPCGRNKRIADWCSDPECIGCQLRTRHNELLDRHGAAWANIVLGGVFEGQLFGVDYVKANREWRGFARNGVTFKWHAGLPADFTLSLDAWMGQRCEVCRGTKEVATYSVKEGRLLSKGKEPCPDCAGTGRVNALGPKLLAAAPVRAEGLRFAGMEPQQDGERYWWFTNVAFERPRPFVPPEIFALMGDDCEDSWHGDDDAAGYAYPGFAAAHDAIARAAIAEAKAAMTTKGATSL